MTVQGTFKMLALYFENRYKTLKSIDLNVGCIYHRLKDRVRAHVFLCMPAYHVEWHMRRFLSLLLFEDHKGEKFSRVSVQAPAQHSRAALGQVKGCQYTVSARAQRTLHVNQKYRFSQTEPQYLYPVSDSHSCTEQSTGTSGSTP